MTLLQRTVGAAAVLGLAGYGARELLHRQALAARRLIGKPLGEEALAADRVWRRRYGRSEVRPLRLIGARGAGPRRRAAVRPPSAPRRPRH